MYKPFWLIDPQGNEKGNKSPLHTPGDDTVLTNQGLCNKTVSYPRLVLSDMIGSSYQLTTDHESAVKGITKTVHEKRTYTLSAF